MPTDNAHLHAYYTLSDAMRFVPEAIEVLKPIALSLRAPFVEAGIFTPATKALWGNQDA